MALRKICDFCLDEPKGLFNRPEQLLDKHYLCKNCRKVIEGYGLPIKYDLFQILVTGTPEIREMQMETFLETHSADECIAKYYPLPSIPLHSGERCISVVDASIRVKTDMIPQTPAVRTIADVTRKDIVNLTSDEGADTTLVNGKLFHTDGALYFLADNFINCHRLTNIIHEGIDTTVVNVLEGMRKYEYKVEHADLFFIREKFYYKVIEKMKKKKNLIYIASENTMTITPGVYSVPRNIQAGTYYVSAVKDKGLHIKDANGIEQGWGGGRIHLDEGSHLEVTGEYQFRINQKEELDEVLNEIEKTAQLEALK